MQFLILSMRGLLRNRRRSLVTLLAIALGFAAIALFAGYTHNIYRGLSLQAIHNELLGHLTLSRLGMSREGKLYPERYLLRSQDVASITRIIKADPHVVLVTPRLTLSGIISNGRVSTIFVAEGVEPAAAKELQAGFAHEMPEAATDTEKGGVASLNPAKPYIVALAQGLADLLHLKSGDQAALLTNTISGQANALDITVGGTFNTSTPATNDLYAFIPLELARSLYDAAGRADRLTILLDNVNQTDITRTRLLTRLQAIGFEAEIHTWYELSAFYTQVHNMFDMIFGFIFSIVLTVVIMSVANSMSMAVVERTREIGTLRAIGLRRNGVIRLFVGEAAILTIAGCVTGLLITIAVKYAIDIADIRYTPPNQTMPVPLLVDLDMVHILFTALMMIVVAALAAWLPARRAAKQPIIDALGHV